MTKQRQREQEWLYQLPSVLQTWERAHAQVVQIRAHMYLLAFHGMTQPPDVRTEHPESVLETES